MRTEGTRFLVATRLAHCLPDSRGAVEATSELRRGQGLAECFRTSFRVARPHIVLFFDTAMKRTPGLRLI